MADAVKHAPAPHLPHQILSLYVKLFGRNYGNPPENFDPRIPPFKITQGQFQAQNSFSRLKTHLFR